MGAVNNLLGFAAEVTAEKTTLLKKKPQNILIVGDDGRASFRELRTCYPRAKIDQYGVMRRFFWQRRHAFLMTEKNRLAARRYDLIVVTPTLWQPQAWQALMTLCLDLSQSGAALFVTTLGRESWQTADTKMPLPPLYRDMHALGDDLWQAGWRDVVMDRAKVGVRYQSRHAWQNDATFWQLEANTVHQLATQWQQGREFSGEISLEWLFAHAICPDVVTHALPEGVAPIHFYR